MGRTRRGGMAGMKQGDVYLVDLDPQHRQEQAKRAIRPD